MINSRTVDGIHRPKYVKCSPLAPLNSSIVRFGLPCVLVLTVPMHFRPEDNKYTEEELLLLKNKDMGYILQSIQSEKKVCDEVKVFRANK